MCQNQNYKSRPLGSSRWWRSSNLIIDNISQLKIESNIGAIIQTASAMRRCIDLTKHCRVNPKMCLIFTLCCIVCIVFYCCKTIRNGVTQHQVAGKNREVIIDFHTGIKIVWNRKECSRTIGDHSGTETIAIEPSARVS